MGDYFVQVAGNISDMIVAVTAFVAAIYGFKEYRSKIRRDKFEALSNFNHRFTTDETLCKVTKWLTNKGTRTHDEEEQSKPSLYDFEIYCRFAEELEIGIERKYLNPQDVKHLFSYYFNEAKDELVDYNKGSNEDPWCLLRKFIRRMKN